MNNRTYTIAHLPENVGALPLMGEFFPDRILPPWKSLREARIDQFPWKRDYAPECAGRVGWNQHGLHVLLYGNEPVIRCEETQIGGDVYLDSCLEFFVAPDANRMLYVNCESNPLAIMHIGIGSDRHNRFVYACIPDGFHPTHSAHRGAWWAVSYTIPADFIQKHFDVVLKAGMRMRGNFYSTGDQARNRHNGMFQPYDLQAPDYHRPDLFADFYLEA